jgi:serine phosphatase RsbU (regulator of sigma subunit)
MASVTNPVRTYGWRTRGEAIREMLIGALIGCIVVFIEKSARDELPGLAGLARYAIVGGAVIVGSRGLETALSWAIEQSRIATIFRTLIYAAGGWLGYFVGVAATDTLIAYEARHFDVRSFHFAYAIAMTGGVSVLIGLILHHNRKRNDRLAATVARLKEHEFAEKELEIARSMQERLLPPARIEQDGFRVEARTQPAHLVAGDFYDVIQLPDDAIAILAADVSGKGIAASLLMASCKAMVPFLAPSGSAADVMSALNARLWSQLQRREFVAMVFARYQPATGRAEVVNAGMPDPFLITKSGDLRPLSFRGDRLPLGAMRNTQYESTVVIVEPGERILLFSDGLPEALADGAPIGYERAEALVRGAASVEEIVGRVVADGTLTVEDDLTLVMLERRDEG